MSHSLTQRVEQVRAIAALLAWLYALSRFVTVMILASVSMGLMDYSLRPHDFVFRWLLSALAAGAAIWALLNFAIPALTLRQNRVSVARRIELRYPHLGGRLSSALAFLSESEDDPTAGSADLRRAVVAEAEAISSGLDFRASLDRRASSRAAAAAVVAIGFVGLLAVLNPAAAGLGVARLAQPWRELPWPRQHELAFVDAPQRLAAGDDVELTVIDRCGAPPDRVELLLRYESPAGSRLETKEMKLLGERMVLRLDNVTRSFTYRARGGDDDTMAWSELTVVEPPKIVELQVLVRPPSYSGLPAQSAGRVVKALIGSNLVVQGRLDKPIRSAIVRAEATEPPLPKVEIAADGLSFVAGGDKSAWVVRRPQTLWFELTDEQGLVFGRDTRIELQAVADSPPSIAWESPGDHSFVTARAMIAIDGMVKDDLALQGIQLRYLRPGISDEEQVIDLYVRQATNVPEKPPARSPGGEGESRPFHFGWELSRLSGLQPGDVLAARITAEDFQPQLATTVVRRLTIITEEELADRIAIRQTAILSQLADALRAAQQCREQTTAIESHWQSTGQLVAGDLHQLQSVQHNHQQVRRLLGEGADGAEGQIVSLLGELAVNHVESQTIGQRLSELLAAVRHFNTALLPNIEQEFTEALKAAGAALDSAEAASPNAVSRDVPLIAAEHIAAAGREQDQLIGQLEKLLGTLHQWDSFSRLAREVGQIREDEERLITETEDLRLKMATTAEVAATDRAAGRQLATRQQELARRLDKLQTRMEEMLTRLTVGDPLAAGALADALDTARRLAIGGQMREAASQLNGLQVGEARATELMVLDRLKQLLNSLSLRRDVELARTVASLRQAASDMGALSQLGATLKADADAAAASTNAEAKKRELARLTRALQDLSTTSEQLARRLARLRAPRAAASLDRAAAKAAAAAQAAGTGDDNQTQQQAGDAQQELEQAAVELAHAISQTEEELAREQLARMEQTIVGLAARQKNVIGETSRLQGARDAAGNLTPDLIAALQNAAAEERLLSEETDQLRPRLAATPAFGLAAEGAAEAMRQAGRWLQRGDTGETSIQAEQSALIYLEQILDALQPETKPPSAEGSEGQQPASSAPPGNQAEAMAELKLLKLLQDQVNRRTAQIELQRAAGGELTPAQRQELLSLAEQQGRLADMILGLVEATVPRPEDQLDQGKLPSPRDKPLDRELLRGSEK